MVSDLAAAYGKSYACLRKNQRLHGADDSRRSARNFAHDFCHDHGRLYDCKTEIFRREIYGKPDFRAEYAAGCSHPRSGCHAVSFLKSQQYALGAYFAGRIQHGNDLSFDVFVPRLARFLVRVGGDRRRKRFSEISAHRGSARLADHCDDRHYAVFGDMERFCMAYAHDDERKLYDCGGFES